MFIIKSFSCPTINRMKNFIRSTLQPPLNTDKNQPMKNTFSKDIIPFNEKARLQALYRYRVLENLPDRYFGNLARIIAQTFDAPIALISLVDEMEVNFPGNYGMT